MANNQESFIIARFFLIKKKSLEKTTQRNIFLVYPDRFLRILLRFEPGALEPDIPLILRGLHGL